MKKQKTKLIKKYDVGGDIGAGLTGVVAGVAGTLLPIPGVQQAIYGLDKSIRGPLNNEERSWQGYGIAFGAIGTDIATGGATTGQSIGTRASGVGQGVSAGSPNSQTAKDIGTGLNYGGMAYGMTNGFGQQKNIGNIINKLMKFGGVVKYDQGGQLPDINGGADTGDDDEEKINAPELGGYFRKKKK